MNTHRSQYIDNIKGFLIILVVLGHVIQYAVEQGVVIERYISSFHMPLFMAISGYCSYGMRFERSIISKRAVRLLVPFLSWAVVKSLLQRNLLYFWTIIQYPDRGLWFLQALFFITLIIVMIDNFNKYKSGLFFYGMIFLVWILITSVSMGLNVKTFGLPFIGWHLPFFTLGFAMRQYNVLDKMSIGLPIVCLIVWCVAGYWCSEDLLAIQHVYYRLAEMAIASLAIIGWLGIFHAFLDKKMVVLSYLGRKTHGIYSVTLTTEITLLGFVYPYVSHMHYLLTAFVLTAFLICFALGMHWLLDKNRYSRILFLGQV